MVLSANGVKTMSAFIVSHQHIATICNAVTFNQTNQNIFLKWLDKIKKSVCFSDGVVSFEQKFIEEIESFEDELSYLDNYKLLAKILVNANFESYNYRYTHSQDTEIDIYLSEVNKLSMRDDLGASDINYFQFIKLLHCLNYQSCEHPDYDKSFAKAFISIAEELAIYNAPEYTNSVWAA